MPYVIKHCPTCGKEYHVHLGVKGKVKKITGACEHIKISRLKGRPRDILMADAEELDKMFCEEYEKSKKVEE